MQAFRRREKSSANYLLGHFSTEWRSFLDHPIASINHFLYHFMWSYLSEGLSHGFFYRICVLRKDHHCFVSGGCVGLANQRFFIVFLFWATIGGALGTYLLFAYLNAQIAPLLPLNWLFYIGPVAVMRAIFGYETLFNAFLAVVSSLAFASTFGAAAFLGAQVSAFFSMCPKVNLMI